VAAKNSKQKNEEILRKLEKYINDTDIPILAEFCYLNNIRRQFLYENQSMSDSIKKLIEKWGKKYKDLNGIGANISTVNLSKMALDDFLSLLEFKQQNCCGKNTPRGIKDVYERFKHLDSMLSNKDCMPAYTTCYELWKAIKNECE